MTPLVLGLALCLLAVASLREARGDGPPSARQLLTFDAGGIMRLAAYCLPALYVLCSFGWWHGEGTRYRFALRGVGFRDAPEALQKVTLGAEPSAADVVFTGLPAHAGGSTSIGEITWRPAGAGDRGTAAPALELSSTLHSAVALLGRERGHLWRETELELQIELAEGDLLRIDDRDWRVDLHDLAFTPVNRPPGTLLPQRIELPRRVFELPLVRLRFRDPIGLPQTLGQRTYRVDWLAADGDLARADTGRFSSFLYRGRSLVHHLYLVDLDPEVKVMRAGAVVRPPAALALAPGDRVRIFSLPGWDGRGFAADGLRERHGFRAVTAEPGCLAILFDTPEVHTLSLDELRRLDSGGDRQADLRLLLTMGSSPLPASGLHFREVSTRVAREALATLDLEPGAGSFQVASSRGVDEQLLGRPFWLGGESAASLQIDRLSPPLALGWLLLAMALAKSVAARAAQLSALQLLLAMAVESLLAVRLVLAYRAWALAPNRQAALDLALVACALVPWIFLAVSLPRRRGRQADAPRPWLPAVAGCALAAAWCWRVDAGASPVRRGVWLICLGAVAAWGAWRSGGLPPWRWVRWIGTRRRAVIAWWRLTVASRALASLRGLARRGLASLRGLARRGLASLRGLARRGPSLLRRLLRVCLTWLARAAGWLFQPWRGWVWLAFTGGRFILLVFGWKESINLFSSRFSLTLLHVPGAVLCQAGYLCWLWRQLRMDPDRRGLSRFWTFSLGVWIIPAVLVSDNGLALVNWPIFILALATVRAAAGSRRAVGWRMKLSRYGATAALAAVLFSVGTPVVARLGLTLSTALPQSWQQALLSERNYLRVVHFADPARLEEAAVRPSEDLATMSVVMKAYTAGPRAWFGHGYFGSEVSPQLRATALRDHLPSVLIAGCWGLAGALGVIAICGVLSALSGWLLPWHLLPGGTARERAAFARADALIAAGGLAGLTLGLASLYMLLTNYDLLPFTGRNVYLLGLDSTADVLESLALIVLLAIGASTARERLVGER